MEVDRDRLNDRNALAAGARYHDGLADTWTAGYAKHGFRRRLEVVTRELGNRVVPGSRWLDAGCGSGILTRVLSQFGANGEAVDGSPSMIRRAREEHGHSGQAVDFRFGLVKTIERLEFEDASFDGVLCSSVIEYVDAPERVLQELVRVLKPGGHLFLSVANRHSVVRRAQSALRSARITKRYAYLETSRVTYTRREIIAAMKRLDMEVQKAVFFDPTLPRGALWALPASMIMISAVKNV